MKGDFLTQTSFPCSCLRKWLQKIVNNLRSTIPTKPWGFWDTNYFPPAVFLSPVLMISLFDTQFCFLIRWSQNVSAAPYAARLMWTHYFGFDIISIQTCQPVQIGLQTVPSRAWDVSCVTNEQPSLWRISQWEAWVERMCRVTTIFHVPSDFLLPCHTQQQSTQRLIWADGE